MTRSAIRALVLAGALAAGVAPTTAPAGELFDLLRPGSRAALGLGGDPFRSPLRDESGWWSEPGFAAAPGVRMRSRASEPLAAGAEGGRLSAGATSWRLEGRGRLAGRTIAGVGLLSQPRWDGAFDAAGGGVRLTSEGTRAEAALRVGDLLPGLHAQAAAPLWSEPGGRRSAGEGAGVRYRPARWVAAQASWTRARVPGILESDLYDQPLAASLNLRSERVGADARAGLPAGVALEVSAARARYAPIVPRTRALEYQIGPGGASSVGQVALEWAALPRLRLLGRETRAELDLEGELSWGGERFGRLDYARGTLRSTLLALEARLAPGSRLVLDAERVGTGARARGTLETWPFTSTIVDLLGLRRIGRAELRARWDRLHAGIERAWGEGGALQLGATWYDARLDGFLESWRPVFLVFGRADVRVDRPGFDRAQLAAASIGLARRVAGLELGLALEQFVFAKTFSVPARESAPAAPATAAPPSDSPRGDRGWPGGTSLELTLGRRF